MSSTGRVSFGRVVLAFNRFSRELLQRGGFAALLAPALQAFLVRDDEQPTPEFPVLSQAAHVPRGADERLLDDVQAGLLVVDQFKHIHIQRQLVATEEKVPGRLVSGPGLRHGQLFRLSHYQHLQPVECR